MARLRLSRCVVTHTLVWRAGAHVLLILHMHTYERNVSVTKKWKGVSSAPTQRRRIVSLALIHPTEVHSVRPTHQLLLVYPSGVWVCVWTIFFHSDDSYRQV